MARKPTTRFDTDALRQSLDEGARAPLYVLPGGEAFFRMQALRLLRERLLEGEDPAVSLTEYDEPPEPAEVLDGLRSPGLFSARQLVVIDPADKFIDKHADALARYLDSPGPNAFLVLAADRWSPKGGLKNAKRKGAVVVSCEPLHRNAVAGWLTMRARVYGKRLNAGVAKLLVETAGENLAVLDRHLQNLAAYVGDRPNVASEDVENLVGGDPQRATWELVSLVVNGKTAEALRTLDQMFRRGTVVLWVISALTNEFSRLWRVKRMIRDGAPDEEMLKALGYQYKNRLRFIKREAERIHPARLLRSGKILLDFDLAAKTSTMPDELLLECLVVKLCEK